MKSLLSLRKPVKLSFPFGLYRVEGESMLPNFRPGDILIGRQWFLSPQAGDVVVAKVDNRIIIKRVKTVSPAEVILFGDNTAASTDSRSFGPVPLSAVRAKIIAAI